MATATVALIVSIISAAITLGGLFWQFTLYRLSGARLRVQTVLEFHNEYGHVQTVTGTRRMTWDDFIAAGKKVMAANPGVADALCRAGTTALAAASIAALFIMLRAPAPLPLTASIDGGGHRHFIATIDPARGQMVVSPAAFAAVPDRVPELWLIVPGNAPHALGLLNADRAVTITIPDNLRAHTNTNASLAVSIEPPGGSPTGAPTGPVVAQGKLTSL